MKKTCSISLLLFAFLFGYSNSPGKTSDHVGLFKISGWVNGELKYGLIDKTGKVVVAAEYDEIDDFSEGLAGVKKGKERFYIDRTGKIVIRFKREVERAEKFSEGLAAVREFDRTGYIDKTGQMVIPLKFDYGYEFTEGLAPV